MMKKIGTYLLQSKYAISVSVLVFVVLGASLITSSFLTADNLITVLRQTSVLFILSSGLTAVVLTGGIEDLPGRAASKGAEWDRGCVEYGAGRLPGWVC